jgi:hypothetical protein
MLHHALLPTSPEFLFMAQKLLSNTIARSNTAPGTKNHAYVQPLSYFDHIILGLPTSLDCTHFRNSAQRSDGFSPLVRRSSRRLRSRWSPSLLNIRRSVIKGSAVRVGLTIKLGVGPAIIPQLVLTELGICDRSLARSKHDDRADSFSVCALRRTSG